MLQLLKYRTKGGNFVPLHTGTLQLLARRMHTAGCIALFALLFPWHSNGQFSAGSGCCNRFRVGQTECKGGHHLGRLALFLLLDVCSLQALWQLLEFSPAISADCILYVSCMSMAGCWAAAVAYRQQGHRAIVMQHAAGCQ